MSSASKHPGPAMSYQEAMRMQFTDLDTGELVFVWECHASAFRKALYAAIETHPACNEIKLELRTLLFRYRPDKWYAVCIAEKYGVEFAKSYQKTPIDQSVS